MQDAPFRRNLGLLSPGLGEAQTQRRSMNFWLLSLVFGPRRNRLTNRLREQLWRYFPAILDLAATSNVGSVHQ
jgi:hypothetical protein